MPLKAPLPAEHYRMSIEVAEHLPQDMEGYFIFHLFGSGGPMPTAVVFSWAVVGQGGHGHVNCQPQFYWMYKFRERNFDVDWETTAKLISRLRPMIKTPWIPLNSLVFTLRA